jgi:hypothetical protein
MDFPTFQAELGQIAGHVQAFAAIGAMLRLHQAKQQAHPAAQAQLLATEEAELPGALDGLNEQQISDALAHVTFLIGEATELFQNPDRLPLAAKAPGPVATSRSSTPGARCTALHKCGIASAVTGVKKS